MEGWTVVCSTQLPQRDSWEYRLYHPLLPKPDMIGKAYKEVMLDGVEPKDAVCKYKVG